MADDTLHKNEARKLSNRRRRRRATIAKVTIAATGVAALAAWFLLVGA